MTTAFKGPPPFVPGPDPASSWADYKESYEIYSIAANLNAKSIAEQRATLLYLLGPTGLNIYKTLHIPETDDARTVSVILAAFDDHYSHYKNLTYLRYTFFNTKQGPSQTFDQFYTDLKTKAQKCEFAALRDSLIATQIVCGIRHDKLRKELLATPNLTMEAARRLCQAEEVSTIHSNAMGASAITPVTSSLPSMPASDTAVDVLQRHRPHPANSRLHSRPPFQPFGPSPRHPYPPPSGGSRHPGVSPGFRPFPRPPNYNFRAPPFSPAPPPARYRQPSPVPMCPNCGHPPHNTHSCPARFSTCVRCRRKGHWGVVCRSAHNLHAVELIQEPAFDDVYQDEDFYFSDPLPDLTQPLSDEGDEYLCYSLTVDRELHALHNLTQPLSDEGDKYLCYSLTVDRELHALHAPPRNIALLPRDDEIYDSIYLFDIPVSFKIDTGAQVNIITAELFDALPSRPVLRAPTCCVRAYSGHPVPMLGVTELPCTSYTAANTFTFYVTKDCRVPILGASAALQLGIIQHHCHPLGPPPVQRVSSLASGPISEPTPHSPQDVVQQYHAAFDAIGRLPGVHRIVLKDRPVPVICAAHQVPFAFREPVRLELERMQRLGIIVPVTGTSDWVHPMVVQPKPDGSVRVCMDPRTINPWIKRLPYHHPTTQEIFAALSGKTVFTVLDVQSAFWHIALDEASSHLCTFATPYGRFRYLRFPNGLVTGSELCQQTLRSHFPVAEFPDVHISTDDFLLASSSLQEHTLLLCRVLQRALEVGLCFGRKKISLAGSHAKYLGHIVTSEGVQVNPARVSAICNMSPPADRPSLMRFLGMINYIARFIPEANTHTAPLRALLKRDVVFQWEPDHQLHYDALKRLASTAPVLSYFDSSKPITLSVDSSQTGFGMVLLQDGRPVEYASTALTPAQCRYSQIEKELGAIVFACEHSNNYVAGKKFTVETDHNPLLGIIKKPLNLLSPRLQRLMMRLFRYQFDLVYVPGSKLHIADALSRAPEPHHIFHTDQMDGPYAAVYSMSTLPAAKYQKYQRATAQDPVLTQVVSYSQHGWPRTSKQIQPELKPYWAHQDELHTIDGLVYRGASLVVPVSLRRDALQAIHGAHQGIAACLAKAKIHLFWPGMTEDITRYVRACALCASRARANSDMPLHAHPIPHLPWETAGTDLFHVNSQNFILLVDYFSKFVEAQELTNTTTDSVIKFLTPHFARHGPPQRLISDNGPPFNSAGFKEFLDAWGVMHITSSPYHPQSNGLTERTIQTIKNALVKARREGKDLSYVLMEYRSTPRGSLPSPAEMSMGRRIRTLLTTHSDSLRPRFPIDDDRAQLQRQQAHMVAQHVGHALPPLSEGQRVWYLAAHRKWLPAIIISTGPEPRSYVIRTDQGQVFRRSRVHLKPLVTIKEPVSGISTSFSTPELVLPGPSSEYLTQDIDPTPRAVTVLGNFTETLGPNLEDVSIPLANPSQPPTPHPPVSSIRGRSQVLSTPNPVPQAPLSPPPPSGPSHIPRATTTRCGRLTVLPHRYRSSPYDLVGRKHK